MSLRLGVAVFGAVLVVLVLTPWIVPHDPGRRACDHHRCRFRNRCVTAHAAHVEHKCADMEPALVDSGTPGHLTRCWIPMQRTEESR
ncbi:hypothetical protein [Saccharopolyspora sp. ASAGF58]|uniref:hypothetical protein n=1 Tax=Saccharopolyspora sp. ASAGF58 TaxID=2719023 RepID=UPI00144562A1|nr:hypothetical protein [Saccharopolyspora sp. ASAGF58]